MAKGDIEDIVFDDGYDAREREYIRQRIPAQMQESYTDDDIQRVVDATVAYFCDSGILDGEGDDVELDLDQIADAVATIASNNEHTYNKEDVFFIVQADLDFTEGEN